MVDTNKFDNIKKVLEDHTNVCPVQYRTEFEQIAHMVISKLIDDLEQREKTIVIQGSIIADLRTELEDCKDSWMERSYGKDI